MDRATSPADDIEIKPRPLEAPIPPLPESTPAVIVPPVPRDIAPKGVAEQDGCTEADRLLGAIVLVARREHQNKGALRNLITKFSSEYSLDF
jgi:hypothetical protein